MTLRAGFEPARGDPIGFQVQRLNHSAITAVRGKSAPNFTFVVSLSRNGSSPVDPGRQALLSPALQGCSPAIFVFPAALETYLGFLETSGSTTEKASSQNLCSKRLTLSVQESRVTPHIDRVLQSHRQRRRAPERVREVGRRQKERQQEGGASWSKDDYEPRLMQLETQLSQLLQKTKVYTNV